MSHDQAQANLELALDRAERKAVRLTFARYVSAIQRVAERATSASARTGTSGARACPRRTEALSAGVFRPVRLKWPTTDRRQSATR
jgi:hypothetical protein